MPCLSQAAASKCFSWKALNRIIASGELALTVRTGQRQKRRHRAWEIGSPGGAPGGQGLLQDPPCLGLTLAGMSATPGPYIEIRLALDVPPGYHTWP
jgi:hypothetical protein